MKRLAVLGHPVTHSRSPAMQTAALEALGLAREWSYEAIDVSPEALTARVRSLPDQGFIGVNVTIPHKEAALALATEASVAATEIGAANTLTFGEGEIRAENTDAPALLVALPEPPAGQRALVLGAGGAARAVAWALATGGADVEVWNRTPSRAGVLLGDLAPAIAAHQGAGSLTRATTGRVGETNYHLLVNCTSVGLASTGRADPFTDLPPLSGVRFGPELVVVDLVYGRAESILLREARAGGASTVDGLEILVRQGAESLRAWTGLEPPLDAMRAAARGG